MQDLVHYLIDAAMVSFLTILACMEIFSCLECAAERVCHNVAKAKQYLEPYCFVIPVKNVFARHATRFSVPRENQERLKKCITSSGHSHHSTFQQLGEIMMFVHWNLFHRQTQTKTETELAQLERYYLDFYTLQNVDAVLG